MISFMLTDGVTLAGALNLTVSFTPQLNDTFTIIANDGTDPVIGEFADLPEGAILTTANHRQFRISYVGRDINDPVEGNGNDVTLTYINQPPTAVAGGPYTIVRRGQPAIEWQRQF